MINSVSTIEENARSINLDGIIDIFTCYTTPKSLRKSIFTIYSTLTQYLLSDGDICCGDPDIIESMYLLKLILESCEELDNVKESKLKVIAKSNL